MDKGSLAQIGFAFEQLLNFNADCGLAVEDCARFAIFRPIDGQVINAPRQRDIFRLVNELMSGEFSSIVTTSYARHYTHRSTPLSADPARPTAPVNSSWGRTPFLATR